jgi:hypothetical protein
LRKKLPNRRPSITHDVQMHGERYHVTFGYDHTDPDLPLREVFIHGPKPGSTSDILLCDMCVQLSISLQRGLPIEELTSAMLSGEYGEPQSILGWVAHEIKRAPNGKKIQAEIAAG